MKKKEEEFKLQLASKPKADPLARGDKMTLITNYFRIRLVTSNYIHVYSIKFGEEIPDNNTPLKRFIMHANKEQLKATFKVYTFSGNTLFSPTDIGDSPYSIISEIKEKKFQVTILRVSLISVQDIAHAEKNPANAQTSTNFLNLIVKSLLFSMNMFRVGKAPKYLMPSKASLVPESVVEVWPGYFTSVGMYDFGLLLEVDYSGRVLRQDTVYDFIRCKYKPGEIQTFSTLKEILAGKSILTRYGNKAQYIIDDIDFDTSPQYQVFDSPDGPISVYEYFLKKYMIKIRDKNQPLLVCKKKQRNGEVKVLHLVPELCSLTGLPDELKEDRYAMKSLSPYTRLSPDQRMEQNINLVKSFYSKKKTGESSETKQILSDWNLQFDLAPVEVIGRVLPPQELSIGKGKKFTVGENGNFNLREELAVVFPLRNWIVVHTEGEKAIAKQFVDNVMKASKSFNIDVAYPIEATTRGITARDYITSALANFPKSKNTIIVVFVLPQCAYYEYSLIKKFATTQDKPFLSQVVLSRTLHNHKGQMSICSKILLQMVAKLGSVLWKFVPPPSFPRQTMVVGIDVSKEGSHTCIGLSSSYDAWFCQYKTQVSFVSSQEDMRKEIGMLMIGALRRFIVETQSFKPSLIIIYRDGNTHSKQDKILFEEVEQILKAITTKFSDYNPKLLYALVNKQSKSHFFIKDSSKYFLNPRPGTVVHSGIVDAKKYEFLLMPQFVNEGSGTPCRISVLFDNSGLTIETFEEFTNSLCYQYFNWMGPIRVPVPCKYASKFSQLTVKHLKAIPNDALNSVPHFL